MDKDLWVSLDEQCLINSPVPMDILYDIVRDELTKSGATTYVSDPLSMQKRYKVKTMPKDYPVHGIKWIKINKEE